jgi:DNA-binding transcriptional MerR regulator
LAAVHDLIPIGQFATASRLSLKALRLYDENGLLPPAHVDPESGYRWYRLGQLRAATLIALLRSAGMPLVEIRRVLDDPTAARVDEYEATIVDELAERQGILAYVRRYLEEEQMFEVDVKAVGEQPYVSRSKRVRVSELEQFIVTTVEELAAAHETAGNSFTIYHGEVNEDDDGPVEVCLPVATGDKTLPAGDVAFTIAVGEQTTFPEIIGAYDAVASWVKANQRELAGPPREIYFRGASPDRPSMEIAWPIR